MRKKLLGLIGAGLMALVASSPAWAITGFVEYFYADPGHTVIVGYAGMDCSGQGYFYGMQTSYTVVHTWAC